MITSYFFRLLLYICTAMLSYMSYHVMVHNYVPYRKSHRFTAKQLPSIYVRGIVPKEITRQLPLVIEELIEKYFVFPKSFDEKGFHKDLKFNIFNLTHYDEKGFDIKGRLIKKEGYPAFLKMNSKGKADPEREFFFIWGGGAIIMGLYLGITYLGETIKRKTKPWRRSLTAYVTGERAS